MNLRFFGRGAAFNPSMDNTNAFFSFDSKLYLLDCGETTFSKVWNLPEYLAATEVIVIITHLHCDHVGSLASLVSYSYYVQKKPIKIVHPLSTIVQLLDLMGIERECYTFIADPKKINNEIFKLEAISVNHVLNMQCFGYILTFKNKIIFYSGDAVDIPEDILTQFLQEKIQYLYVDISYKISDHPTHGSLNKLETLIPFDKRKFVYCMHLDCDYIQIAEQMGFNVVLIE